MSTYQYYEFLAIDRPLTPQEQQAVARLSSRVGPHPRRAVFTYSWSDFPGRAGDVLIKYYDAMLYMANWGTRQLMFRFPKALFDLDRVQPYILPYYFDDYVSFSTVGDVVVLNVRFREEGGGDWIEGEGWLDVLSPLRGDILHGDYRLLYLAWLKTLEFEDVLDTVLEPPVPPGLGELSPALERFVDLFEIDQALLRVVAEASGARDLASDAWMQRAISRLPRQECESFLLRLARGEPHLSLALAKRLRALAGTSPGEGSAEVPRRSVGALLSEVKRRRKEEQRRRAEAAERKRLRDLGALAKREAETWCEVDALIQQTVGSAYDEAVRHLLRLRELAIHKGEEMAFERRLNQIHAQYSRRTALLRRLRNAGLHPL